MKPIIMIKIVFYLFLMIVSPGIVLAQEAKTEKEASKIEGKKGTKRTEKAKSAKTKLQREIERELKTELEESKISQKEGLQTDKTEAQKVNWKKWGFRLENEESDDQGTRLYIKDKQAKSFLLLYQGQLDQGRLSDIARLHKRFQNGEALIVKEERYVLAEKNIEILLNPQSLVCSGSDVLPYLPGQLFLTYDTALEYKFRLRVSDIFIHVRGFYTTENSFCRTLLSAVENPEAYIQNNNPAFLKKKLDILQRNLEELRLKNYFLSNAVIALENKGWFSGPRFLDPKLVETVVDLKERNPAWRLERIEQELEKKGIEASYSQIRLIFLLHFNEIGQ